MAKKKSKGRKQTNRSKGSEVSQPTPNEMREWYAANHNNIELFKKAEEALRLLDVKKGTTRQFSTFDKSKLRNYLKNPIARYKDLRNLSRYLYY